MTGLPSLRMSLLSAAALAAVIVSMVALPGCRKADSLAAAAPTKAATTEEGRGATPPKEPGDSATPEGALTPVVEVQHEDYAQARSQFQTKLLRQGPAPQPWSPLKPPAGVTQVEYTSGELRLKAWLHRPTSGEPKHPAVLFLHGGFAFDRDDWELSQPYCAAGFVVLAPMLRGENGQSGAFTLWYDEVDDVLAAAAFLTQQPYVDASRLYVAGSSAGGTLALLAASASKRFRAVASFSASPDQALLVRHAKIDLPFDKADARELQMRSPLAYAGSLKCPVRIYYGTRDHFVLTSRRTAAVAQERGLDVEAVPIAGDHGSAVPLAIQQSIPFFQTQ